MFWKQVPAAICQNKERFYSAGNKLPGHKLLALTATGSNEGRWYEQAQQAVKQILKQYI